MLLRGLAIGISLIVAGCGGATSLAPVTVRGECNLFADPGFVVRGETRKDQRWIASTQEVGITNCGWGRPMQRKRRAQRVVKS